MFSKKNIQLLVTLLVLVAVTIVLALTGSPKSGLTVDKYIFTIADTASIQQIQISNKETTQILKRTDQDWRLNDQYKLDEYLRNVLFAVLNRVEIKRAVPKNQVEEVKRLLVGEGMKIDIVEAGGNRAFFVGGNKNKTVSYFMGVEDEVPYVVNLPGYTSYTSGIFELTENEWRDKLVANSHWTSIKTVDVKYEDRSAEDFKIEFHKNLLRLADSETYDTTSVMDYVSYYQDLRADAYFSQGDNELVDSLLTTTALCTIALEDLDDGKNRIIKIYQKLPQLQFHPVLIDGSQKAAFNSQMVKALLKNREEFQ